MSGRSWPSREAGVLKSLRELARREPGCRAELEALEKQARAGRRYLEGLRREVVRLGGLAEPALEAGTLERIAGQLEEPELEALKAAYAERLEGLYPPGVQLAYGEARRETAGRDEVFRI